MKNIWFNDTGKIITGKYKNYDEKIFKIIPSLIDIDSEYIIKLRDLVI